MSTVQYTHWPTSTASGAVPVQVGIPLSEVTAVGATGNAVAGGAFLTYSTDTSEPNWSTTPDSVDPGTAVELPMVGSYVSVESGVTYLILLFAVPMDYSVQVHAWRFVP